MKKFIFLTGFMGCGKTTIGKAMKKRLHIPYYDTDEMIESETGLTIPEIFKDKGEEYFRDLETEILSKFKDLRPGVVSCGGGLVLRPENVTLMKSLGTIVFLTATPESILDRVMRAENRPLLEGRKTVEDITKLLSSRLPAYESAADIVIPTDDHSPDYIIDEILSQIN